MISGGLAALLALPQFGAAGCLALLAMRLPRRALSQLLVSCDDGG
jgi:hypothetical protein